MSAKGNSFLLWTFWIAVFIGGYFAVGLLSGSESMDSLPRYLRSVGGFAGGMFLAYGFLRAVVVEPLQNQIRDLDHKISRLERSLPYDR